MGSVKTIKKGIAIALSMMLAVTVLPTGFGVPKVQAAGEMLYVGNIRVTEANASDVLGNKTISYQASTHTLTLNGANLTTPMKAGKYIYGIRYEGAGQTLNLVLNGTNTITTGNVTDAKECYGIYLSMNDTLKISGTGTLKVTAGNATDESMGIRTGGLKIEQGKVQATSGKVTTYGSTGICCEKGLEATGGSLTGKGGDAPGSSYGIRTKAEAFKISGGTITGIGGAINSSGKPRSYGIYTETTTWIEGGTVTATGGSAAGASAIARSCGFWCYADLYISDGKLTASSGTLNGSGAGYGLSSQGKLHLTGGEEVILKGESRAYDNSNISNNPSQIGKDGYSLITSAGTDAAHAITVSKITDEVLTANPYIKITAKMDITLASTTNGGYTITPNQTKAVAKGTKITVNPVPNTNYRLEKITVKSYDGTKQQTLTGTSFTMPGYPVIINVTFAKIPCTHKMGAWHGDKNGHERSCTLCYNYLEKGSHSDKNDDGKCDLCNYALNSGNTDSSTNPKNPNTSTQEKKPYVKLNISSITLQVKKTTSVVKIKSKYPTNDKVRSYKSSNTKVATVDKKGKVTAKKTGKSTITVTMKSGAKAKYTVKVQKGKVTTKSLKLNKSKCTLKKGKTLTIKVTRDPITATEKITYSSSNKKVATVDKKGKITAKKKGKSTITVKTSNGKKATCKVTVK